MRKPSKRAIRRQARRARAQFRKAEAEHARRIARLDTKTREKLVTGAAQAILSQLGVADAKVAVAGAAVTVRLTGGQACKLPASADTALERQLTALVPTVKSVAVEVEGQSLSAYRSAKCAAS